jgi:Na+/phosphate symporter
VNLELLRLAGGLGLFLLGIVIMTDGLRGLG